MTPTRVAIVGLGEAGHTLHLPALQGVSRVRVVGGCDLSPVMRTRAATAWGIPVFEDFGEMLSATTPDVVIVATPPDTHHSYGSEALRMGAHLICEKPFTSSLAEADDLLESATAAGLQVALNHEFREMPIFRAVRRAIQSGGSDPLLFVQVWQLMDRAPWDEPGWRGRLRHRTLYEAGVHLVDYLIALFGEQPVAVHASTSAGRADGGADAVALATLEFSRGRLASVVQNRLCRGEPQYFEIRADTGGASYRASFGGRARLLAGLFRSSTPSVRAEFGVSGLAWKEIGTRRTILARNPRNPGMLATRYVLEQTLIAFREGTPPPTDGHLGRSVLEVVVACYHSAATGRRVVLGGEETTRLRGLTMGVESEDV